MSDSTQRRAPGHSIPAVFHRNVTLGRTMLLATLLAALAAAVAFPVLLSVEAHNRDLHKSRALDAAELLVTYADDAFVRMFGTLRRLRGFVLSGSPLRAPDYFSSNSTAAERARVAMDVGNRGALSHQSYARVIDDINGSFPGYRVVLIQPGVVNVFSDDGATFDGLDWLFSSDTRFKEYEYMVNTTDDIIVLPRASLISSSLIQIVRSPIFTNTSALVRGNPSAVDPATGRHPNWRYLWGGIVVAMRTRELDATITRGVQYPAEFEYRFVSKARFLSSVQYPHVVIGSSLPAESQSRFDTDEPVTACSTLENYDGICFEVLPAATAWDGNTNAAVWFSVLATVATFIVVLLAFGLARLCVGPEPDPLRFAPSTPPFHAACVDLADANRLWGEVPFVMHEVTMLFGAEVQRQAEHHRVFVALQHGTTAIVASRTRLAAAAFARGMAAWGQSAPWPPHITVHCPRGTLQLAAVLHTCDDAEVRVDAEAGTCEVSGLDVQALLLMRAAAIPQHVICTGEFLRLPSLNAHPLDGLPAGLSASASMHPGGARVPSDVVADPSTVSAVVKQLGSLAELGVAEVPLEQPGGARALAYRGYLLTSPATGERNLNDVIDSLPDSVWAEWRSAQMLADAGQLNPEQVRNPLDAAGANASVGGPWGRSAGCSFGDGEAASVVAGGAGGSSESQAGALPLAQRPPRRVIGKAHLNNAAADERLPANAAGDPLDVRRLAALLVPLLSRGGPEIDSRSRSGEINSLSVTRGPAHLRREQRLRAAVSLATYYLTAYRLLFAPLEPPVRTAMVGRICAAVGVAPDDYAFGLAVRCTVLSMRYVDEATEVGSGTQATQLPTAGASPRTV